jgi:acetyl esterase
MTHAPGLDEFVEQCNAAMPPDFYTQPVERQRALYLGLTDVFPYPVPAGVTTRDEVVVHDGRRLDVRVYEPSERRGDALLVYIRGGGFVVGSLDTHHTVVAELAERTGLVTVAPDFRLAPEHPFPAATEDCYGVVAGLVADPAAVGLADVDTDAVVLCGDSSGGNMAVVVAMMCRDRGGPTLRGQALISPVLDFTRWRHGGEDAPLLTGGEMEYYVACYCPEPETAAHPYVSPLVSGSFDALPPTYVMSAEADSLRVDAARHAELLAAAGTPVTDVVEPGLVHSAVRARGYSPAVEDAWSRFCAAAARLAAGGAP